MSDNGTEMDFSSQGRYSYNGKEGMLIYWEGTLRRSTGNVSLQRVTIRYDDDTEENISVRDFDKLIPA